RILDCVVDANGGELVGHLIAQDSLHQIEVTMHKGRSLDTLGLLSDIRPSTNKVTHIVSKFLLGHTRARGPRNKAARGPFAIPEHGHYSLQPYTLSVVWYLARDADVVDRRHVNNKPSRQRYVGRNASTLLCNRLFGDLNE